MADKKEKKKEEEEKEAEDLPINRNSRRIMKDKKKNMRENQKQLRRNNAGSSKKPLTERALWFRAHIQQGKEAYTESEIGKMLQEWLTELEKKGKEQQQKQGKQQKQLHGNVRTFDSLWQTQLEQLKRQFMTEGLRAPDITRKRNVDALLVFDGDHCHIDADPINDHNAITFRMFKNSTNSTTSDEEEIKLKELDRKAKEMLDQH